MTDRNSSSKEQLDAAWSDFCRDTPVALRGPWEAFKYAWESRRHAHETTVPLSTYESAVKGRQEFRKAYIGARQLLKKFVDAWEGVPGHENMDRLCEIAGTGPMPSEEPREMSAPIPDEGRLNWLTEVMVDTIYLDDGRIIDVGGNRQRPHDIRAVLDEAMRTLPISIDEESSPEEPTAPHNMHRDEWWQAELDRCMAKYRALFDAYVELQSGDPEITAGVRPTDEPRSAPELCPRCQQSMPGGVALHTDHCPSEKASGDKP